MLRTNALVFALTYVFLSLICAMTSVALIGTETLPMGRYVMLALSLVLAIAGLRIVLRLPPKK